MHYTAWSASTGDADWGLRPLFGGKAAFPPVLFNTAYYSNPIVDKDIEAGLTTADPSKRAAAYAGRAGAGLEGRAVDLPGVRRQPVRPSRRSLRASTCVPDGQIRLTGRGAELTSGHAGRC